EIEEITLELDIKINRKDFGANECKFLFAYTVEEQESQSNRHFYSFIQIAQQMGRTMVLTNVGGSRISSLKNFPFDFYYNVDELSKKFPQVKFILQHEFQKWAKERENNDLNQFLSDVLESNAEVMLITQEGIRGPIFERLAPMPYASHITNAASNFANKLKPYIGIHWRMESGQLDLMSKCAESLVTYIRNFGITNIYLATDYPLAEYMHNKAQSDTFHHIHEEHHIVMRILNSTLNINTWVSTHALDYLKSSLNATKTNQLQEELRGGGIQGIFDKLMLIQADYFIGGPENCCRYMSTYTLQIKDAREESFKNNGTIKNVIDRWELY
ncbi:21443_t:CDS:2, partial [Racocetra persica]